MVFTKRLRHTQFSEAQPPFMVMLGKGKRPSRLQPFNMFEDSVKTYTDHHH